MSEKLNEEQNSLVENQNNSDDDEGTIELGAPARAPARAPADVHARAPAEHNIREGNEPTMDLLTNLLHRAHLLGEHPVQERVIQDLTLNGVADYIKAGNVKKVIVMAGAGISTSAGIPDFRSPGSGLYDNLEKYNLPNPQAIFELGYFKENPEPFFQLARQLWPGTFKPTLCHYFMKLLQDKNLLLRHYTQNIDTLERVAGLKENILVEAHGTFHSSHCLECRHTYSQDWMKEQIFKNLVPKCTQSIDPDSAETCDGVVKPDIVFFGERLPERFFSCVSSDFSQCDLLIVMGTSLVVQPFASLISRVTDECLRLYINLENTSAQADPIMTLFGMGSGFKFDCEDNTRDVFHKSTCDDGCLLLAEKLGWGDELRELLKSEHEKISALDEQQTAQVSDNDVPPPEGSAEKQSAL